MPSTLGPFEDIFAVRLELGREHAEIVVNRRALEDALLDAFSFSRFVELHLENHADAFQQEDATEDGDEQFLVDDDGEHRDDAVRLVRAP